MLDYRRALHPAAPARHQIESRPRASGTGAGTAADLGGRARACGTVSRAAARRPAEMSRVANSMPADWLSRSAA